MPPALKRLVVCFDGTWNMRDDSTNVLHHFALALERATSTESQRQQTKYYVEGVGTGVLDGVTGGAFGFGLEEKVRDAYDWLVENYNDGDDLYFFGFSRGAYTARSLVGFISACGIVRRGAPLSVNQLWLDYCVIGRQREEHEGFWDRWLGSAPKRIRRLNDLILDPWKIAAYEAKRTPTPEDGDRIPGQLVNNLNDAEKLFVRWSRRAPVRYLGIYDTVGAMGLDALAIPGLRSKLALHHNMRPTTLITKCRHALALDEHRSSFRHTPFLQYVGHGISEASRKANFMEPDKDPKKHWNSLSGMWRSKIEQRWFVGAHSNVGGGYRDNYLANAPLNWLLQGARDADLDCEDLLTPPVQVPEVYAPPRDSHSEFMAPLWALLMRNKRHYRTLSPYAQRLAAPPSSDTELPDGFSLSSINEQLDESVFTHFDKCEGYRPPNLRYYAMRRLRYADVTAKETARLKPIADAPSKHVWLHTLSEHLVLFLWATLAAYGVALTYRILEIGIDPVTAFWVFGGVALAAALVDFGESRQNHRVAAGYAGLAGPAFLAGAYWFRMVAFLLFILGAVGVVIHTWRAGWHIEPRALPDVVFDAFKRWWGVPVFAAIGAVGGNLWGRAPQERQLMGLKALAAGFVIMAGGFVILVSLVAVLRFVLTPVLGLPSPPAFPPPLAPEVKFAGLLLLLQGALAVLLKAFVWVDEPMARINLVSIRALQACPTPARVYGCLDTWVGKLTCLWDDRDRDRNKGPAAISLVSTAREALWRDILGFIPLYTAVLLLGLFFAANQLHWVWLDRTTFGIRWWVLTPVLAAVADVIEDTCHFYFLRQYREKKKPNWPITLISFLATIAKFAALGIAAAVTLWAVLKATLHIAATGTASGWLGSLALAVSTGTVLVLAALALAKLGFQVRAKYLKSSIGEAFK